MDETKDRPARRFWTLNLRKKNKMADDVPVTLKTTNVLKRKTKSRIEKIEKSGDEKKKGRLAIWKSWFLTMLRTKSKSSLDSRLTDPELVDLSSAPSFSRNLLWGNVDDIKEAFKQAGCKETRKDQLAMTIVLPEGVTGEEIKINVEIKVLPKRDHPKLFINKGIHLLKVTENGPVYTETVLLPPETTVDQVSKMPLYFLNGSCAKDQRIETIIKPLDNVLPENYDKDTTVQELSLRLQFETNLKFKQFSLPYDFVTDLIPMDRASRTYMPANVENSVISFDFDTFSRISIQPGDLVEEITSATNATYDEYAKTLVKEILNQVVSNVSFKSSTDLIEDFHKELEVQKILLLETASSILPKSESLLSKISETDQENASAVASKNTSQVSSKVSSNFSPDSLKESEESVGTERAITTSDSELKMSTIAPSNTPNVPNVPMKHVAEEESKKKKLRKKEEVRADIDKTLELLETAKNKLLKYLNHGTNTDNDATDEKKSTTATKSKKGKKCSEKSLPFFLKRGEVNLRDRKDAQTPAAPSPECEKIIGPLNDPMHEIKHLLLEEFRKQSTWEPPSANEDIFDLDYLAHANVFLDSRKIKEVFDSYLSPRQRDTMESEYLHSVNTKSFDQMYRPDGKKRGKVKPDALEHDLGVIYHELLTQSELIRLHACGGNYDDGDSADSALEDVRNVLDQVIQQVEDRVGCGKRAHITQVPTDPQVYHVNPVYFCLIDDYVDVFPTAGRAGDGGPLGWLAHRLRAPGAPERRSTVTVRRSHGHGEETARTFVEKLERGTAFMSQLYNEICSGPLNLMHFGHVECPVAMERAKEATQPLLRKSKKMFEQLPKKERSPERESKVEEEERVINPDAKERPKMFNVQKFVEVDNQVMDLQKWPSWKREWIKLFTEQYADEKEGLKELSHLINLRAPVDLAPKIDLIHGVRVNLMKKKLRIKPFAFKKQVFMERPSSDYQNCDNTLAENDKNNISDSDTDQPAKELTEKKDFKELKVSAHPPPDPHDDTKPSTSTAGSAMLQLHSGASTRDNFISTEQIISDDESYIPPRRSKVFQAAADIPRVFTSTSLESAYLENVALLQRKIDSASEITVFSSSSSGCSYESPPMPNQNMNYTASMLTHLTNASKCNRFNYAASSSEVSSRSADSVAATNDYQADIDNYTDDVPEMKALYISIPELNKPAEVAQIEQNVLENERLNPPTKSLSGIGSSLVRKETSMEFSTSASSTSLKSTTVMDLHQSQ